MNDRPTPVPGARRRIDWIAAGMALVTGVALAWAAWLQFAPPTDPEPPSPGSFPPPLHLVDPADGEPVVPLTRGKVLWLSFWSAASPTASMDLSRLERARARLKGRRGFLAIRAAVDAETPDRLRLATTLAGEGLPVFATTPETRRAFGVGTPPLHILVGADGRVSAIARGWGDATLVRLSRQAEAAIDDLEPAGRARFAQRPSPPSVDSRRTRNPSDRLNAVNSSRMSP